MSEAGILTALEGWLDVDRPAPALEKACNVAAEVLKNVASHDLRKLEIASRPHGQAIAAGKPEHACTAAVRNPDAWTDDEVRLCEGRARLFVSKGVAGSQADLLACRLLWRDRGMDDRRSCAECASFEDGRCQQYRQPFGGGGIEVLHRCMGFKLEGVSHD